MIHNTVRSDWPKEEKERKLAWLHAQLWKYQRGTFAPPAAQDTPPPAVGRPAIRIIMDSQIFQEFEPRIKTATWEIWDGVEGASSNRDRIYDEMAACQGVVLDDRTRWYWHRKVELQWKKRATRGHRDGKKGKQVIQRIVKGRQYGVSSNGKEPHALGSKGTLNPRDVFGGAQDRTGKTRTGKPTGSQMEDGNQQEENWEIKILDESMIMNLLQMVPGQERVNAHQQEENWHIRIPAEGMIFDIRYSNMLTNQAKVITNVVTV